MKTRRIKDLLANTIIWTAATASAGMLVAIVGFIFANGWSLISTDFLLRDYEDTLRIVHVEIDGAYFEEDGNLSSGHVFIDNLGLILEVSDEGWIVNDIASDSPVVDARDNVGQNFPIRRGHVIEGVNELRINGQTAPTDVLDAFASNGSVSIRVRSLGGGVWPLIVSTVMLIGITLLLVVPLGILAAIYMVEYAKQGRTVRVIRFAIEILAGMPSVVYGLFGMMFFVRILGIGQSMLAGALTMTILLLPIMIRSSEEALKTVPQSYREASFGLGANKIQTIWKAILPSALPGMMVGVILSIGRIVGESAALLFTVGTFARMPLNPDGGALSIFESGATLTLRAFIEVKEHGDIEMAAAIGIVILTIVFTLNMLSKLILKRFSKGV